MIVLACGQVFFVFFSFPIHFSVCSVFVAVFSLRETKEDCICPLCRPCNKVPH